MNWRHWIGVVGLCAISAGATELLRPDPTQPVVDVEEVPADVEVRYDTSETEALWARLRRLENEAPVPGEAPTSPDHGAVSEGPESSEPPMPSPAEMEEARAIYRSQLEDILDSEERDPEWGSQTESLLHETIATHGNEHLTLYGIECRSTLCRLEMTVASEGDPYGTMDALMGQPGFTLPGMANVETDPDGAERIYVFLAREEGGFPEPA